MFRTDYVLQELNHTNIALILKVKNPNSISLCNVSYKILSKILSHRLKVHLPSLISPLQSAFVPGRLLQENSAIAREIYHTMNTWRQGVGLMALKANMEKTYDKMEWAFLLTVMRLFGFTDLWIQIVGQCLSMVSYSLMLNGSPFGLFTRHRGLRRGDPLSPFLFILGTEVLSRSLVKAEASGRIHGTRISRAAPSVSHLLFADETLVFAQANLQEVTSTREVFSTYTAWSGQVLNLSKSSISFSKKVVPKSCEALVAALGICHAFAPGKHLGLPLILPRLKKLVFMGIKENLLKRIAGWKTRFFSHAGRACLIKSVSFAMPSYVMFSFLLPQGFCAELDFLICAFWWGFPMDKKRNYIPKAWNSLLAT